MSGSQWRGSRHRAVGEVDEPGIHDGLKGGGINYLEVSQ